MPRPLICKTQEADLHICSHVQLAIWPPIHASLKVAIDCCSNSNKPFLSQKITDPQVTDQSQANVRDTVDPTSTETGGPATLRSRGEEEIPRNPDFTDFEEQLREIDTAISETATNPEGSPFPDPSPDFEEDKEGILGISKLNEKENKGGRQKELQVGPSTKVDLVLMDLDSAIPTQNNATLGQASSQAQILFSIGPHNQKPSCEAEIRKVRGPAQKKTKQVTNVMGKENAWKKGRDTNKGDVEVNEMMMKSEDDEMGSKRKSRLPLVDITMEEEAASVAIYGRDVAATKVDRFLPGLGGACYNNMLGNMEE
ncbi:hypothetical protein CFP56_025781 [Quercus suber]|uniref:Uncharacterized protein n=1 Tax=Quercus suber TaxID=58331 RepID=A0AAW0K1L7_QUESU